MLGPLRCANPLQSGPRAIRRAVSRNCLPSIRRLVEGGKTEVPAYVRRISAHEPSNPIAVRWIVAAGMRTMGADHDSQVARFLWRIFKSYIDAVCSIHGLLGVFDHLLKLTLHPQFRNARRRLG